MRFFAAFAVIIFHFFREMNGLYPYLSNEKWFNAALSITDKGRLGVNFFFVLSGFLITYLILDEKKRNGIFHWGKFMLRRFLRIWPLYFIIGILGFFLFPLLFSQYSTSHNALNYFTFLANFDEINNGGSDNVNFLTSPWSVAVEEQFYLFWGFLFFLLFSIGKKWFLPAVLILMGVSFYFRTINWENEIYLHYHTLAVFQDILTGSLIAWFLFHQPQAFNTITSLKKWKVISIYLLGFCVILLKNKIFSGQLVIAERLVLSLFFGYIILDQTLGKNAVVKLGKYGIFNYLGKISYGLYMYHLVVFYLFNLLWQKSNLSAAFTFPVYFIAGVISSILVASISYKFIEKFFLKLKPH